MTEPWTLVARRGGRLAALVPLVLFSEGGRRHAALAGGGVSDWLDAVLDPDLLPAGAAPLLERLAEARGRFDEVVLERLPPGGHLARAAPPAGLAAASAGDEEDDPCPAVVLPGDPARLAAVASPRLLANVRQARRRLARAGEVRLSRAGAGSLDAHLGALFALHRSRWASRGEPGVLAGARLRRFHGAAARGLLAAGILRGYVLSVGGRPAAVYHGLLWRRRAAYYLGGFDPAFSRESPGAVVVAHAVEEAIREGAAELDFLRGREAYKYAWGARDRPALRRRWAVEGRGSTDATRGRTVCAGTPPDALAPDR